MYDKTYRLHISPMNHEVFHNVELVHGGCVHYSRHSMLQRAKYVRVCIQRARDEYAKVKVLRS